MHTAFIPATGELLIGEVSRDIFYTLRDIYTGEACVYKLGEEAVLMSNEPDPAGTYELGTN